MAYLVVEKTAAQFTADNPVLRPNQIGLESNTDLQKKGDGINTWNSLGYSAPLEYTPVTGVDTYIASFKRADVIAYYVGLKIVGKFTSENTGASTINLNSLGAKTIKKDVGTDLAAADILAGGVYTLIYDGTNFQLI